MAQDSVATQLLTLVSTLRTEVERSQLPLDLPSAQEARTNRDELLKQLDDYLLPRLASIDAPLLAVVGGSTGAGKSTLINSLIQRTVTVAGALRPTTTSPVLIHHPGDARWFSDARILPGMGRVAGEFGQSGPGTVRLVTSDVLPPGLALLDAPDIDSVVSANRELATQLLNAADLWLFVTTAARYADEVPWEMLRTAQERGASIALVLDRVDRAHQDEIRAHLAEMLQAQGLGDAPLFAIPESTLDENGHIPVEEITPVRAWLAALAGDSAARSAVIRRTLDGALASLNPRVVELVAAATLQQEETSALSATVASEYDKAEERISQGLADATLLRGEVLARWQEFVGTGELFRKVELGVSRLRDRIVGAVMGRPGKGDLQSEAVSGALQSGVVELIKSHTDGAAEATARSWRTSQAGPAMILAHPELATSSPGLDERLERLVRDWQGQVLEIVRTEGQARRLNARIAAFGINGIGLFLMLVTFAHTAGVTGVEGGIAVGTTLLAQRVLEAIFGDQAVREMARKARSLLMEKVVAVLDEERARYDTVVAEKSVSSGQIRRLRDAAAAVNEAAQ